MTQTEDPDYTFCQANSTYSKYDALTQATTVALYGCDCWYDRVKEELLDKGKTRHENGRGKICTSSFQCFFKSTKKSYVVFLSLKE